MSCPGHSLGESYPSVEMQSVYSAAVADGAGSDGTLYTQNNTGLAFRVHLSFVLDDVY